MAFYSTLLNQGAFSVGDVLLPCRGLSGPVTCASAPILSSVGTRRLCIDSSAPFDRQPRQKYLLSVNLTRYMSC